MRIALLLSDWGRSAHICAKLSEKGSVTSLYSDVRKLRDDAAVQPFDAVILGDERANFSPWLNTLRTGGTSGCPIIVVGFEPSTSLVTAVNHGATDFTVIGDTVNELWLRLERYRDTATDRSESQISLGRYRLVSESRVIYIDGECVRMTDREFMLAWLFFSNPGKTLSLSKISEQVWRRSEEVSKRTLEQHVYKLRRKLNFNPESDFNIIATYGVGYRLQCRI